MENQLIETFVRLLVEKKMREAQLSGGRTSAWGSEEHITDLESRWYDMCSWRDRQPKGSEARANYSRIANRLKRELASAKKTAQQKTLQEKDD